MFRSLQHFLILDNIEKNSRKNLSKVLYIFDIMENGAFAPKEQMLHVP